MLLINNRFSINSYFLAKEKRKENEVNLYQLFTLLFCKETCIFNQHKKAPQQGITIQPRSNISKGQETEGNHYQQVVKLLLFENVNNIQITFFSNVSNIKNF